MTNNQFSFRTHQTSKCLSSITTAILITLIIIVTFIIYIYILIYIYRPEDMYNIIYLQQDILFGISIILLYFHISIINIFLLLYIRICTLGEHHGIHTVIAPVRLREYPHCYMGWNLGSYIWIIRTPDPKWGAHPSIEMHIQV